MSFRAPINTLRHLRLLPALSRQARKGSLSQEWDEATSLTADDLERL